jgi:hypothetical protein
MRRWLLPLALLLAVGGLSVQVARAPQEAQAAAYRADRASTFDTYLQQCQGFAGLGPDVAFFWDEFVASTNGTNISNYLGPSAVGTGTLDPQVGKGGTPRLKSGATANSSYSIFSNATIIANPSTERWCIATRFKIATATDTVSIVGVGMLNSSANSSIMAGFAGALHATNFIVQFDGNIGAGTALNLNVAKDTNFHTYVIYGVGDGKVRARLDGGVEVSATLSSPPTTDMFFGTARNGTTAADRQMDLDWLLVVSTRS